MNAASISGAGRGLGVQADVYKSSPADANSGVKSTVEQAQRVVDSQSGGKSKSSGILSKIGNALKDTTKAMQSAVKRLDGRMDAMVKKSPILSFVLGLTTAVLGMGLITSGVVVGAPLAAAGLILLAKSINPFVDKMKESLKGLKNKPSPETQPLVPGADDKKVD